MPDDFDPYHKWLGIPPAEQPPNHYRLLGITVFETDPEVIQSAAYRQTAHIRTYARGAHVDLSQTVLNEIAAAQLCLLDPMKRAAYNVQLKATTSAPQPRPAGQAALRPIHAVPGPKPNPNRPPSAANARRLPPARVPIQSPSLNPRTNIVRKNSRNKLILMAIGIGLLAGILLLSIIIRLDTQDGTLVVKVNEPGAVVEVLDADGRVEVTRTAETDKLVIAIDPGRRRLRVSKPGFEVFAKEFSVEAGGEAVVEAELIDSQPEPNLAPPESKSAPAVQPPVNTKTEEPPSPTQKPIAEEVLRRGGSLKLLVDGRVVDVNDPAAMPSSEFDVVEVGIRHADASKVADLAFLANARNLQSLSLFHSQVTATSLTTIAGHPNVRHLNLEDTGLPTDSFNSMLPLPKLEELLLANCTFDDHDLLTIGTLDKLKTLGLQGAKVTDLGMNYFKQFPDLEVLLLYNTAISDDGLAAIGNSTPNLRLLVVGFTKITDVGLKNLNPLKKLRELNVAYNAEFTGDGFQWLGTFPELASLNALKTKVRDDALNHLAHLTKLKTLVLSENEITDAGLKHLTTIQSLGLLEIEKTKVTAAGIADFKKALPNCRVVTDVPTP